MYIPWGGNAMLKCWKDGRTLDAHLKNIYRRTIRPSLKIMLFPVYRSGEIISAELAIFPPHFRDFSFSSSIFHGLLTSHNYGHPLDKKHTFLSLGC